MKHLHHIIPKHMGGTDSPENLIELTIEEHAVAHENLWEKFGKKEDFIAWKCLSGKSNECENERIELAKEGFFKFMSDPIRKGEWIDNIKESRKSQVITEKHRQNISKGIKRAYLEGRKNYTKPSLEQMQKHYRKHKTSLDEGRKKSTKWRESVSSASVRHKKRLSDPRSTKIIIDDVVYDSIRQAAKESGFSYAQIRKMIKEGLLKTP